MTVNVWQILTTSDNFCITWTRFRRCSHLFICFESLLRENVI